MSLDYAVVKLVHQGAVALSVTGFMVRGVAGLAGAAWVRGRLARTLPHVVDTVLIVSAVWLAVRLSLTPANAPWIAAKIAGLVVYIALGMVALRLGPTRAIRAGAWVAALITFGYIVTVALTKDPRGVLVWMG